MAKRKTNGQHGYGAYVFKEKDPVIAELRGLSTGYFGHDLRRGDIAAISKNGGPSATCIRAWFFGDTKRPQNATVEAAGRAMGKERVWRNLRRNTKEAG